MKALIAAIIIACLSTPLASAIGPFEIVSSDSNSVLRLRLVSQLQTVWESKETGGSQDRESALFMKARRIRPTVTVSIPEYETNFRLHLSLAPGSIELMDLYFDTRLLSTSHLRVGQYKIPFTRYRIQSFQRLTFADWSVVTKYFGAERQIGLSLHNGYEKPPRVAYAFGVFNGVNARASHATGIASVFGEKVANPSDLSESSPKAKFHPELACHIAYNSEGIDVGTDSDAEGGELRYSVASSFAWDLDPADYQDLAVRAAQECLVKYRHFSFMGAGYLGFTPVGESLRSRIAMTGLLAQTSYRATDRYEVSLRYAFVNIDNDIANTAHSRAQTIISETDNEDIAQQYRNAGAVLEEHEGTLGFNVYLDGHSLKIQNDIGVSLHDRRDGDRTDYLFRSQIQLSF